MPTCDLLVVGAGPAGCAAAVTAARRGLDVVVVDKARFPRDKCCGDGLTTGALRLLAGLGFDPRSVPSWQEVGSAWVRSPTGYAVEFPFPAGAGVFGAVAPRRELDAALVALARSSGATVHEGHGLSGVAGHDEDGITVVVDGLGELRARWAIGADGMWSPLRRALGLTPEGYRGEWHAFRQYAEGVTGDAAERLWVWFDEDLLPGYAWSFPLPDGRANVGFGVRRDGRRPIGEMGATWEDLLRRPHVRAALGPGARLVDRHTAWPIPARVDTMPSGSGRALLVGDAVAATDPMTGEGIGQALLTGMLAAEAVAGGGDVQAAYRAALRRELVADHRMSVALGRVLCHGRGARASIRIAGATAWTRRNFARWLFEDEPRAALLTPGRWHRGFLRRPGVEFG